MRDIYIALGLILSLGVALYALSVSLEVRADMASKTENSRYKAKLQTDEQAALQYLKKTPVFEGMTDEQLARRALSSLCRQIDCSRTSDYVYSFGRDGSGAAGAFWYKPADQSKRDKSRNKEHFLCRFRNEDWVICHVVHRSGGTLNMVYARSLPVQEMADIDKVVKLRPRYPTKTKNESIK
jgi:hypothetical protein